MQVKNATVIRHNTDIIFYKRHIQFNNVLIGCTDTSDPRHHFSTSAEMSNGHFGTTVKI